MKETSNTLNIPVTNKARVVVVGGGFGGINLIKRLKGNFQTVLIDRYNYHTFQPLLYQVATAGLEPDSIAGPLRKLFHKNKSFYFRMLTVTHVYPELHQIDTSAGRLDYDFLVLATGSKMNYFGNKRIAQHAFPLKQIPHALDLRSHIFQQFERMEMHGKKGQDKPVLNFVVVGAGPTGVEVCGALAELRDHVIPKDYHYLTKDCVKIYLIEGLSKVLPGVSQRSSDKTHHYLKELDICVKLNCLTEDFNGKTVTLSNGVKIKTETLIWAAGVTGNAPEGFNTDSLFKGKLVVNTKNQLYSNKNKNKVYSNIFALGDASCQQDKKYPKGLPGLAQVAIQQGKHLGYNLSQLQKGKAMEAFTYRHKGTMATIGKNKAVADLPGNKHINGFFGWFIWMVVHLMSLIGFRNKVIALTNWIYNYFTFDRGVRLILKPSSKIKDKVSFQMKKEMNEA